MLRPSVKPEWRAEAFDDLEKDVRQSIACIEASPFIPRKDKIRGFVYKGETGRVREVVVARIGVHTGDAIQKADRFVGTTGPSVPRPRCWLLPPLPASFDAVVLGHNARVA